MKKIFSLFLIFIMSFAIVACDPREKPNPPQEEEPIERPDDVDPKIKKILINGTEANHLGNVTVKASSVLLTIIVEVPNDVVGVEKISLNFSGKKYNEGNGDLTHEEIDQNKLEINYRFDLDIEVKNGFVKIDELVLKKEKGGGEKLSPNFEINLTFNQFEEGKAELLYTRVANFTGGEEIWTIDDKKMRMNAWFSPVSGNMNWFKEVEKIIYMINEEEYSVDKSKIQNVGTKIEFDIELEELDGNLFLDKIILIRNNESEEYQLDLEINIYGGSLYIPIPRILKFEDIFDYHDKNFELNDDVDLRTFLNSRNFTESKAFEGIIEGNGHSISDGVLPKNSSLLGFSNGGEIRNVKFTNNQFTGSLVNSKKPLGFLFDEIFGNTILENIELSQNKFDITRTLSANDAEGFDADIGLIAGNNEGNLLIENLIIENSNQLIFSDHAFNSKTKPKIGGVIGRNAGDVEIVDSVIDSNLSLMLSGYSELNSNIGGVIGYNEGKVTVSDLSVNNSISINRLSARNLRADMDFDGQYDGSLTDIVLNTIIGFTETITPSAKEAVDSLLSKLFKEYENFEKLPLGPNYHFFNEEQKNGINNKNELNFGGFIGHNAGDLVFVETLNVNNNIVWDGVIGYEKLNYGGMIGKISNSISFNDFSNSVVTNKLNLTTYFENEGNTFNFEPISKEGNFGVSVSGRFEKTIVLSDNYKDIIDEINKRLNTED